LGRRPLLQIRRAPYCGQRECHLAVSIVKLNSRITHYPSLIGDKDGLVEIHQKFDDVIVVQTGIAVLIVGGEVIEPASPEPGEIRGRSIRGGTKRSVTLGDVIHITAGTPHQFLIASGDQITYILVKIAVP
jgi:hypothetical protein